MESISHLNLNTGHIMQITKDTVKSNMRFKMEQIRRDALKEEGVEILDGTIFKLTEEGDTYAGTLFYNNIPLVHTTGAKHRDLDFWKTITEYFSQFVNVPVSELPPAAPYACDVIMPGIMMMPEIATWTGDFTKCVAWLELLIR